MAQINTSRLRNLEKVGFYKEFDLLKKEHAKEIENFTTRFRIVWNETRETKQKIGIFTFKRFLSKYIIFSLKEDIKQSLLCLIIMIDENIIFPIDSSDEKKLKAEHVLLNKFIKLFQLYQIDVNKSMNCMSINLMFMDAITWPSRPIKYKFEYQDAYFMALTRTIYKDDEKVESFIKFSKEIGLYPTRYYSFLHQCIISMRKLVNEIFIITITKFQEGCE